MKRIALVVATIGAVLAAAGLAQAGGAKVGLRKTKAGKILVNGSGFTLYVFSIDKPNQDNCNSTCQQVWPPLTTKRKVVAGPGIKRSLLGTITIAGGKKQVTYAKHPLYRYIADGGPAETSYIGTLQSGGRWYALNGAGRLVKKK